MAQRLKGRVRRLAGVAGRHRVLAVAACIVVLLVLAGAVGALVRSPARPTITAAPPHASVKVPAAAPNTTTTTPAFSSSGSSAHSQERRPLRCRARNGVRAGEHGHAAEHAEPAERRRGPIRQDRADRFPDADRRPREAEPDGHAVGRARRLRRRLRGQLADAVGCNPLGQRDAPGAGEQLRRGAARAPRRSAGRRTSRPRPPTSPASTSICSRASPPCRPAASST